MTRPADANLCDMCSELWEGSTTANPTCPNCLPPTEEVDLETPSGFENMAKAGYKAEADTLAKAFIAAHDLDQLYAVLRFTNRSRSPLVWLADFLGGCHWTEYQNIGGEFSEQYFETARNEAYKFLGE